MIWTERVLIFMILVVPCNCLDKTTEMVSNHFRARRIFFSFQQSSSHLASLSAACDEHLNMLFPEFLH